MCQPGTGEDMSDRDSNDQIPSTDVMTGFDLGYAENESSLSAFTDLHPDHVRRDLYTCLGSRSEPAPGAT